MRLSQKVRLPQKVRLSQKVRPSQKVRLSRKMFCAPDHGDLLRHLIRNYSFHIHMFPQRPYQDCIETAPRPYQKRTKPWYGSGTVLVRSWYGLGTVLVRSWYGLGTVLVWSWYGLSTVLVRSWYICSLNMPLALKVVTYIW